MALLQVLCAQWFDLEPKFVKMNPDLPAMLKRCDAALLIGDRALFAEHETVGLDKVDLGEEWAAMNGLPFVWAFWAGRPDVVQTAHVEALQAARTQGSRRSTRSWSGSYRRPTRMTTPRSPVPTCVRT